MGITHTGVEILYNFDIGSIPLTIVIGLRARVNPVGMEIATKLIGWRPWWAIPL